MQFLASNRQSLLDVAIITLGSVAGVFALSYRNRLPVTATLADGQPIEYSLADVISPRVRDQYARLDLRPATGFACRDRGRNDRQYQELLYLTGSPRPYPVKPPVVTLGVPDTIQTIIDTIDRGDEYTTRSDVSLSRLFSDPFDDSFA